MADYDVQYDKDSGDWGAVASESGCKSTGRFAASWVSIRAGELK